MSYATEVKLLILWLVGSGLASIVLTVVLLVRQPPDPDGYWRTVRRHAVVSALLCCCLPLLLLVVRTVVAVYENLGPLVLAYWWAPLLLIALGALAAGGWLLWRWQHAPVEVTTPLAPESLEPVPEPVLWSLPDADRHGSLPR